MHCQCKNFIIKIYAYNYKNGRNSKYLTNYQILKCSEFIISVLEQIKVFQHIADTPSYAGLIILCSRRLNTNKVCKAISHASQL